MKRILTALILLINIVALGTQPPAAPTSPTASQQTTAADGTDQGIYEFRNQELINIDGSKSRGFDKALESYLDENNRDSNLIFMLGNEYFRMNFYEKAFKVFSQDPTDYKNLFGAATTARLMGDYATAVQYYNRALDKNSSLGEAYLGRGMANRGLQNFDEAISDLTNYLKFRKDENIYLGIAGIYIKTERYKEAKDILEKGRAVNPGSKNIKQMLNMVSLKIVQ